MKYPLVTGFCGGLLIFAGCAYLGHRGAEIATYRVLKPWTFPSLKSQNDRQLRADLLTLQAVGYSQFVKDTPSDLQKTAEYLEKLRNGQPPELTAILNLQIATYYAEAGRLEREMGNAAAADHHVQIAEDLLRSLGWKDTSSEALAQLTHRQIWWRAKK